MRTLATQAWQAFPLLIKLPKHAVDIDFFRGPIPVSTAHSLLKQIQAEIALRFAGQIDRVAIIPALYPLIQVISRQHALLDELKQVLMMQIDSAGDHSHHIFDFESFDKDTQGTVELLPSDGYNRKGFEDLFILPVFCHSSNDTTRLINNYLEEYSAYRSAITVTSLLKTLFQIEGIDQCDFMTSLEIAITPGARLRNETISALLANTHQQEKMWSPLITRNMLPMFYDGNTENNVDLVFFSFNTFARYSPSKDPEDLYLSYADYVQDFVYYKSILRYQFGVNVRVHVGRDKQYQWLLENQHDALVHWLALSAPEKQDIYREKISMLDIGYDRPSEFIVTPQTVTFLTSNFEEIIAYSVYIKTVTGKCIHIENIYSLASAEPDHPLRLLEQEASRIGCEVKLNKNHGVLMKNATMVGLANEPYAASQSSIHVH